MQWSQSQIADQLRISQGVLNQVTFLLLDSLAQVLEKFLGSIPENNRYQQQILSMYLSCSGYTEAQNKCLDRVVCDYSDGKSSIKTEEKDVISM